VLALGLSGCADSTTSSAGGDAAAQTATTAPADPKAALAASTKELANGNYAFTASSPGAAAEGMVHTASKSAALSIDTKTEGFKFKLEMVLAEPDRWIRMTTGGKSILDENAAPDTWFHVDTTKLKKGGDFDLDVTKPDILYVGAMVDAVTEVTGDAHTVTGKLDATKIGSGDAFLDTDSVKRMGVAASALPFTATLDDQGRLTKLEIDAPKTDDEAAGKWTITVTGYGEQKALTKPSGPVKETSKAQLELFNS
jgi:hypothetical protein